MSKRAGSKQTGHYLLDGTEYEIKFGVIEMTLWEKAHKGEPYYDGSGAAHISRTLWCIWSASKRAGQHSFTFDEFPLKIEDAWVDDPNDEENEGHQDPPDGSTPDS